MRQCTSARGKTLEKWLRAQQLTKTDTHFFYVPRRGTWQHNITKQWYELDGMITPIGTHRQVQRIRTRPTEALSSDHNAKEFYVHLRTLASTSRRQQRRQRFQSHEHQKQHQDRIRDDLLQGPISSDIKKQYRDRLDELLRAEGILLPRPPKTNNRNPVYIFTDGSCGKTNNSIAGWGVVAYETEQIEASLMNNIGKHTVPADYTMCGPVQLQQDAGDFLGACHYSNNTAEISAIGHALVLARTRYQKRPVTICYDSEYAASVSGGHSQERLSRGRTATQQRNTRSASRKCGRTSTENRAPVVKFPSEPNTTALTESSENSNTKQSKNTFSKFAMNWKKLWKTTTWGNSTKFYRNWEFNLMDSLDVVWNLTAYSKSRPTSPSWAATRARLRTLRLNKECHNYRVTIRWGWHLKMQKFSMN